MRHSLVCAVALLLLTPIPSEAWWDWIKELSGPGPSKGHQPTVIATVCVLEWFDDSPLSEKDPCIFVDRRAYFTIPEENAFPNEVEFQAWDFGASWRLAGNRLQLGAGAGFMRFTSDDQIDNIGETVTRRFTLTLPRIVLVPLRFIPGVPKDNGFWATTARVVKFHVRMNIIIPKIDAPDFGVPFGVGPGRSRFIARIDPVWSYGFMIDLGELLPH